MASGPFIEHYEMTRDIDFLRESAYPFVSEVARFYASYVVESGSGRLGLPHSCAQEFCSAQGGPGINKPSAWQPQRSPTIDLSYARWILNTCAGWAATLGVDAAAAKHWREVASRLEDYPLAAWSNATMPKNHPETGDRVLGGCEEVFPWAAASNCTGFAESTNADTNRSQFIAANAQWPIANLAPIHPTGQISLSSDRKTLLLARNTVWMLNTLTDWRPGNGLCLAWPPAARLADKHDPYPFATSVLLDNFEAALHVTMNANFWPDLAGGGLEQVGATHAVNELLLQSFVSRPICAQKQLFVFARL